MPMLKLCSHCRCAIPYSGPSVCQRCRPVQIQESAELTRHYNRNREKQYARFYHSSKWLILKAKKLQDAEYLCEYCKEEGRAQPNGEPVIAQDVHHTVPIQTPEGWLLRYDINRLKCACVQCHNREHGRFGAKKGRQDRPPGGCKKVKMGPGNIE